MVRRLEFTVKISIIVPAFNEAKLIAATLRCVREAAGAFAAEGWTHELIVCDNHSTDGTGDLARAEGATVVFEPVNQIARARNRGAAAASGDWLIFLDADSWPSRELFADVVQCVRSGRCVAGGVIGRMDLQRWWAKAGLAAWNRVSRLRCLAAGWFFFCEAAAFRRLGGYNEALFATEDIDVSLRFRRLARATGRELVILHRHPLRTSARKESLYSCWAYPAFLLRIALSGGRSLTRASGCSMWYDGRR